MTRTSSIPRLCSNGDYWQARWFADGVRRGINLGKKSELSRRQADAKCRALAPKPVKPGKTPTLDEWGQTYQSLRDGDTKALTRRLDSKTLDYLKAKFGNCRLDQITPADADDFRAWLLKQPVKRNGKVMVVSDKPMTLSKQTVAKHIRHVKGMFTRAKKRGLIEANPFEEVSAAAPAVAKEWAVVSLDDLAKIIAACPNHGWQMLFALCRLAGLRRGEAMRLRWCDMDPFPKMLRVLPESGEEGTKQKARLVPVQQALREVMGRGKEWPGQSERLVCDGVSPFNLNTNATKIIKAAGLPAYSKPFHTLRKNLESEWMAQYPVMAVCEWLGHAPAVAMKHYVRPTAEMVAKVTGGSHP